MKKIILIVFLFISVTSFSQKKDSLQMTDSTAILSIIDVNDLLKYLSNQEMKPITFILIKSAFENMINEKKKQLQKKQ